jgi:hypothetical protein
MWCGWRRKSPPLMRRRAAARMRESQGRAAGAAFRAIQFDGLDTSVIEAVIAAQAAAEATAPVGTDEIVFRICEAIWYGSPCEFGRRSSR